MLAYWGALMLVDRVWKHVGINEGALLALGDLAFVWGFVARWLTPLAVGSVMTGLGTGVLAANAPDSRGAMVQGGLFLLSFASGWALLALTSTLIAVPIQRWAWIPAAALATLGTALLLGSGGQVLLDVVAWAMPIVLVVGALSYLAGAGRPDIGRLPRSAAAAHRRHLNAR
jgi:hypothetical protein